MIRLYGVGSILLLLFWVYCLFDVIASESALVRNLGKVTWIFLVVLLGPIGGLAWLLLGRPERAGWRPGDTDYRRPIRVPRGVEDRPGFGADAPPPSAPARGAHPSDGAGVDPPPADAAPPVAFDEREKALLRRQAELDRREAELEAREQRARRPADEPDG